ncbi:hypothetical protein PVAND_014153 [Polypedilum vanderplanki]|nr:hypothetical protein PVAND_014153 [Polypedilum vanderplanki]
MKRNSYLNQERKNKIRLGFAELEVEFCSQEKKYNLEIAERLHGQTKEIKVRSQNESIIEVLRCLNPKLIEVNGLQILKAAIQCKENTFLSFLTHADAEKAKELLPSYYEAEYSFTYSYVSCQEGGNEVLESTKIYGKDSRYKNLKRTFRNDDYKPSQNMNNADESMDYDNNENTPKKSKKESIIKADNCKEVTSSDDSELEIDSKDMKEKKKNLNRIKKLINSDANYEAKSKILSNRKNGCTEYKLVLVPIDREDNNVDVKEIILHEDLLLS